MKRRSLLNSMPAVLSAPLVLTKMSAGSPLLASALPEHNADGGATVPAGTVAATGPLLQRIDAFRASVGLGPLLGRGR